MIQDNWLLLAIFAGLSSFSIWADQNTKWGKALSSTNVALIAGMILVNLKIVPAGSDIHDVVFTYAVPIAIALLLFQADIREVIKLGPKLILAFVVGAISTTIGAIVAAFAFDLGPQSWIAYGMLTGTYIGGSANLAAIGNALKIDPSIFVAINAADLIIFFFWLVFLFQAGKWPFFKKLYPTYTDTFSNNNLSNSKMANESKSNEIKAMDIVIVLGLAIGSAALGEVIGSVTGIPGIIFTTTIVLLLASFTPVSKITVSNDLGIWFFMIFCVANGSLALFSDVAAAGPKVFLGTATVVLVHGIVIFLLGKLTKLPLEYILLSSCANIGGPSISGPLAAAYKWDDLVLPGILIGVLGAAVGTYCGFGMAYVLKSIL